MVRSDCWAEPSLAARREARRLGMAMAAMMPMIATTIKSSMREKPFWPLFCCIFFQVLLSKGNSDWLVESFCMKNLSCRHFRDLCNPGKKGLVADGCSSRSDWLGGHVG